MEKRAVIDEELTPTTEQSDVPEKTAMDKIIKLDDDATKRLAELVKEASAQAQVGN